MVQVGIDVGSFNTSVVILADTTILAYYVVSSDEGESEPGRVTGLALEAAGLHWDGISTVVATGCGRSSVDFAHEKSSEVVCQARGSLWLFPEARTVINLGAESSRAISLNEQGKVRSFATNDKCAAGSGLFLESIAHLMGIPVAEMGELALGAETTEEVSSRCAVFAESEVISHIHRGVPKENILAGVHQAIADRILDLISKITVMPDVVFTGGMARNPALMKELEKRLGLKACIPAEPRIVGALGAALLARE
ncbi:MAG: acyl-CoA dehydratase activase, partial [Chloroflexota bacterium]|nr:acyl-CoA dehydratase activase [Chloroflexota bacterium]